MGFLQSAIESASDAAGDTADAVVDAGAAVVEAVAETVQGGTDAADAGGDPAQAVAAVTVSLVEEVGRSGADVLDACGFRDLAADARSAYAAVDPVVRTIGALAVIAVSLAVLAVSTGASQASAAADRVSQLVSMKLQVVLRLLGQLGDSHAAVDQGVATAVRLLLTIAAQQHAPRQGGQEGTRQATLESLKHVLFLLKQSATAAGAPRRMPAAAGAGAPKAASPIPARRRSGQGDMQLLDARLLKLEMALAQRGGAGGLAALRRMRTSLTRLSARMPAHAAVGRPAGL